MMGRGRGHRKTETETPEMRETGTGRENRTQRQKQERKQRETQRPGCRGKEGRRVRDHSGTGRQLRWEGPERRGQVQGEGWGLQGEGDTDKPKLKFQAHKLPAVWPWVAPSAEAAEAKGPFVP